MIWIRSQVRVSKELTLIGSLSSSNAGGEFFGFVTGGFLAARNSASGELSPFFKCFRDVALFGAGGAGSSLAFAAARVVRVVGGGIAEVLDRVARVVEDFELLVMVDSAMAHWLRDLKLRLISTSATERV
jgi:hypothetical protein